MAQKRIGSSIIKITLLIGLVTTCCEIAWCALMPSPDMRMAFFIPEVVADWANNNPTFRNFPAFALLAMLSAISLVSFKYARAKMGPIKLGLTTALAVSIFGTGLEIAQLGITDRIFDTEDITWTIIGAFSGVILAFPLILLFDCQSTHG
jgi:hypothetical protein